ncbi:hypothetical protein PZA11_001082 [Diplocarpon coronariae]|uniref:Defect at low temperature protein 1 n=1 Tax=Diplocarpon coronariae TaxID=2795749 RepID=A0A218YWM2_9HELO|nr:hypothetical protein JHW43_003608 [Diplocarpon mali]OWO99353.1 hypothetical protein B2J93_8750 [Marssonina coronariae]
MAWKLPTLSSILYSTFYIICQLGLIGLLFITPADLIVQARHRGNSPTQVANYLVIPGGYGATALVAFCIYAWRVWYKNPNTLKKIPKAWIPVEQGEVSKHVREMIVGSISRSAIIAWDSRPRTLDQSTMLVSNPGNREDIVDNLDQAVAEKKYKSRFGIFCRMRPQLEREEHIVTISSPTPVWGEIRHNGWSSPTSPDLPNLQYITVILELPHLIEAKAVSLAPLDPESTSEPLPDVRALDLLQRSATTCLRKYIGHLVSVGVITSPPIATDFVAEYEYARFSGRTVSESRFRELMKQFADLLRSMEPLSPAFLTSLDIEGPESDIDDGFSCFTPVTRRSRSLISSRSISSRSGSEGTICTDPVRSKGSHGTLSKKQEVSTAPPTASRKQVSSRSGSTKSSLLRRRPYDESIAGSSESSLRSTSQGSVIRLDDMYEDGYSRTLTGSR